MVTTDKSLTVQRIFAVSPEVLWDIWTDEKNLQQWHRPNTKDFVTEARSDARVGGAFHIKMTGPEWTRTAFGHYRELDKPRRLVCSWQWENDPSGEVSQVSLDLKAVAGGTELTLVHSVLSGPESVKAHLGGWLGCMENIAILFPEGGK